MGNTENEGYSCISDREINNDMRRQAYMICRDYLHGRWKHIKETEMVIKHIRGGLSNLLYYCALPKNVPAIGKEPSEVLVRCYGQVHGEEALESLLAESVIFTLLSERRLGPRLYGVFPGGRIEQYIPARPLTTKEMSDPVFSRQISTRLASMHSMNIPIIKEPTWIWNSLDRWLKTSEEFLLKGEIKNGSVEVFEKLRQFNYREEIEYLKKVVEQHPSPVVFAHNDLQEGNILFNSFANKSNDKISLIDFEYCAYNYRGFDIANHFCEWLYSYKNQNDPYFNVHVNDWPTEAQQLNFIRSYLRAYDIEITSNQSSNDTVNKTNYDETSVAPPHINEECLLEEVKVYGMASHLMWTLWSIVQSHISTISFGYMDYALVRMNHYVSAKQSYSRRNNELNKDE